MFVGIASIGLIYYSTQAIPKLPDSLVLCQYYVTLLAPFRTSREVLWIFPRKTPGRYVYPSGETRLRSFSRRLYPYRIISRNVATMLLFYLPNMVSIKKTVLIGECHITKIFRVCIVLFK